MTARQFIVKLAIGQDLAAPCETVVARVRAATASRVRCQPATSLDEHPLSHLQLYFSTVPYTCDHSLGDDVIEGRFHCCGVAEVSAWQLWRCHSSALPSMPPIFRDQEYELNASSSPLQPHSLQSRLILQDESPCHFHPRSLYSHLQSAFCPQYE